MAVNKTWDFNAAHSHIENAVREWINDPRSKEPREYKPYPYQTYAQNAIIEHPAIGLFLDMGLGKTVITLSALRELKFDRWAVNKTLIIAPKKVAEDTWQTEAKKWTHLQGLRIVGVLGTATRRTEALAMAADIYVTNRENTQWLVEQYKPGEWPFDTVVLDESSSFKNHQAKRFRALKTVRPRINRIIELTGTPNPHGLMDLWAQLFLLDGGKRLGQTISVYRDMYFIPDKRSRTKIFSYVPKDGADRAIYRQISDICISMKAADYLDLPELVYEDIPVVLDSKAVNSYQCFEKSAVLQVEREAFLSEIERVKNDPVVVVYHFDDDGPRIMQTLIDAKIPAVFGTPDGLEQWQRKQVQVLITNGFIPVTQTGYKTIVYDDIITANTAAALSNKLLQLCNGAVYDENHEVVEIHDCKIEAFLEAVEGLNGQHALVCYSFIHDKDRLLAALSKTGLRVRVYADARDKDAWNRGEIDILLIHPASCSYGLNLQEGGHHIIWFGLTWNLEEYQQTNKRLHRQGQQHPVIVHHLIVKGGRDEDVIRSLESKDNVQESLLESLKVRIKEAKEGSA